MIENVQLIHGNNFAIHLLNMLPKVVLGSFQVRDGAFYNPSKNDIYFSVKLPSIEHEIAHMVEIRNAERLVKNDWAMPSIPKKIFPAVCREIRVRTIQNHFYDEKNRKTILQNLEWVKLIKEVLQCKKFSNFSAFVEWHNSYVDRIFKQWSIDKIESEWKVRTNYISNWMDK